MHFERLREANRAEITIDARTVSELRSPETLQPLAEFAEAHSQDRKTFIGLIGIGDPDRLPRK